MEVKLNLKLHKTQNEVFTDKTRFRILTAGRRWGKTWLACIELVINAVVFKGSLNWYIAPTYKQAKMIAWRRMLKLIPRDLIVGKPNESELKIELVNGSIIELKGADNEDSLRGVGVHFVVLDEYASMKSNVWQEIIRPMLTDTKGRALFIGTPKGKNQFWELFVLGERGEKGYKSWRFTTYDNPYIDREEIEQAKQQLADRYFKQEYLASFEDYTGLIYPEFTDKNIIEGFEVPAHWERVGVIDTAISGVTAVLFGAISPNGTVYCYREYYEANKRVSEVVEAVKRENPSVWIIDSAAKGQKSFKEDKIWTLYDEYVEMGVHAQFGQKDVAGGINRVAGYFQAGKLKIFTACKNLIWELERYHWADSATGRTGVTRAEPYKEHDHLADCLRYLIMSRPDAPERPRKTHTGYTEQDLEEMEEKQSRYDEYLEEAM